MVSAYARRLAGDDAADRTQAALDWDQWENVHISLDPLWTPATGATPGRPHPRRRDISGPVVTPWRLHQQWPASQLIIVESEGHGGPESLEQLRRAVDTWAGPVR